MKNYSKKSKQELLSICKSKQLVLPQKTTKRNLISLLKQNDGAQCVIDLDLFSNSTEQTNITQKPVVKPIQPVKPVEPIKPIQRNNKKQILKDILAFKFKEKNKILNLQKLTSPPTINAFISYNNELYQVKHLTTNIFGDRLCHVVKKKKMYSTKFISLKYSLKSRKLLTF